MKLPRIADHYFNSRLTSDMAERSHSVHNIRALPALAGQIILAAFQLLATAAAVIWIDHGLWLLVFSPCIVSVGLPLAAQPVLGERELRVRTHGGASEPFLSGRIAGPDSDTHSCRRWRGSRRASQSAVAMGYRIEPCHRKGAIAPGRISNDCGIRSGGVAHHRAYFNSSGFVGGHCWWPIGA